LLFFASIFLRICFYCFSMTPIPGRSFHFPVIFSRDVPPQTLLFTFPPYWGVHSCFFTIRPFWLVFFGGLLPFIVKIARPFFSFPFLLLCGTCFLGLDLTTAVLTGFPFFFPPPRESFAPGLTSTQPTFSHALMVWTCVSPLPPPGFRRRLVIPVSRPPSLFFFHVPFLRGPPPKRLPRANPGCRSHPPACPRALSAPLEIEQVRVFFSVSRINLPISLCRFEQSLLILFFAHSPFVSPPPPPYPFLSFR